MEMMMIEPQLQLLLKLKLSMLMMHGRQSSQPAPTVLDGSSCPRVSGMAVKLTLQSEEILK